MTREEMKLKLQESIMNVTFVKVNGDKRVLNCTLRTDLLPPPPEKTSKVSRPVNEEVLAVWDLDNSSWRSFRLDSIIKLESA